METRSIVALMGFAVVLVVGCGPAEVVHSTRWNVHDTSVAVDHGAPLPAEEATVTRGARYQVKVALTPKHSSDATVRNGEWAFYKDGRLFGRIDANDIDFTKAPTIVAVNADSATKRHGKYTYELYLDDELVTEVPVEILATPHFQPAIRR